MMISRREQNKINSRARILKASRKLFSSKGYENTMIEDIASRAEISKATLYNYFPNKESLLIGIEQELIIKIKGKVQKNIWECHNSELMLRHVVEEVIQELSEYWNLARRITYLNSCEESALYNSRKDLDELFMKLVVSAQNEGIFRNDIDPEYIAETAIGIYLNSLFLWDHIEKYSSEQIKTKVNKCFDIVMSGYYVKK